MIRLIAVGRHDRQAHPVSFNPILKLCVVAFPNPLPCRLDTLARLQLCKQERGKHVRRNIARSHINPRIFVYFTSEEAGAIGALLPDDLRSLDKSLVVNQQCATLSAGNVFRFVKTLRCEAAKDTEEPAAIFGEESMRVVFYHG